jgi:hypothetical protein
VNRRTGLGRHSGGGESAGDPLDGLVNLFDIGIVLAVAFLVAGIGLTLDHADERLRKHAGGATRQTHTLPSPTSAPSVSGRGQPVGRVYRLGNGQLVYVEQHR